MPVADLERLDVHERLAVDRTRIEQPCTRFDRRQRFGHVKRYRLSGAARHLVLSGDRRHDRKHFDNVRGSVKHMDLLHGEAWAWERTDKTHYRSAGRGVDKRLVDRSVEIVFSPGRLSGRDRQLSLRSFGSIRLDLYDLVVAGRKASQVHRLIEYDENLAAELAGRTEALCRDVNRLGREIHMRDGVRDFVAGVRNVRAQNHLNVVVVVEPGRNEDLADVQDRRSAGRGGLSPGAGGS